MKLATFFWDPFGDIKELMLNQEILMEELNMANPPCS